MCATAGFARAGGLAQLPFDLANFNTPLAITNVYWPMAVGTHIVHKKFCPNVGFVGSESYGVETTDSEAVEISLP
ncbi:MAG TPA: hypothetical protein VFI49_07945 [Rudaea sp.]|nr:hypothetical protein [Rudaea sp.]